MASVTATTTATQAIKRLQPAGTLLAGLPFKAAVALLERPYIPMSAAQHERVRAMAEKAGCDTFRIGADGPRVTFGEADGGYALMPIAANAVLQPSTADQWTPIYSRWRHGGWYVDNIRYPSGGCGCVSRNYEDGKWRIACDSRRDKLGGPGDFTFPSRDAAARAERKLVLSLGGTVDD